MGGVWCHGAAGNNGIPMIRICLSVVYAHFIYFIIIILMPQERDAQRHMELKTRTQFLIKS